MRCATASVRTWSMWGSAWRRLRSWQVMTAWRRRGGTANRPSRISNKWWSSSVRKSRNSPSAYPSRMLWPLLHESLCNPHYSLLTRRGDFYFPQQFNRLELHAYAISGGLTEQVHGGMEFDGSRLDRFATEAIGHALEVLLAANPPLRINPQWSCTPGARGPNACSRKA